VAVTMIGLRAMFTYASTPGPGATPPEHWPAGVPIARSERGATLVLFAHPACPCTRASLHELAELARDAPASARIEIVFVLAGTLADASWDLSTRVPGAVTIVDDGAVAARFNAATSGTVVIYDRDGKLAFTGGITAARGHVGDNVGRRDAAEALAGRTPAHASHAVFGCALIGGPA
jgi:hypothetical protein